MSLNWYEETDACCMQYLEANYAHRVVAFLDASEFVLLCNTSEIKEAREILTDFCVDPGDVNLFKSFFVKYIEMDGEKFIGAAWGLTRVVPWPDSQAFWIPMCQQAAEPDILPQPERSSLLSEA